MSGVVQQYYEATKEVEDYAEKYDQHWEVREAFDDNLAVQRRSWPEETYSQAVRAAIETTKHEILEAYGIQQDSEQERVHELEGYRMRL